ncbi:very short patch repair endonuclease [Methylophaga sp. OBS4]|uniref:very short patch repair endonuclease n=1 Tax=Methylophaga sp. OBS4 TaxID=2991935 RepID=UPI00225AE849|nr:very short patch repair endonuclease [Methylophaga sp. OBS4]MCX4187026.1 very short patch repair endonuclease [Methylophaga sp. OBS4]
MDTHRPEVRKKNMRAVKSKNTKPEIIIRKALHGRGFRYKLHDKSLPGKPDLVFPKYRAVIEIYGCFWHGHNCKKFSWPNTNEEFWKEKISNNRSRDSKNIHRLMQSGWRVLIIWECSINDRNRLLKPDLINLISDWLVHGYSSSEINGTTKLG